VQAGTRRTKFTPYDDRPRLTPKGADQREETRKNRQNFEIRGVPGEKTVPLGKTALLHKKSLKKHHMRNGYDGRGEGSVSVLEGLTVKFPGTRRQP